MSFISDSLGIGAQISYKHGFFYKYFNYLAKISNKILFNQSFTSISSLDSGLLLLIIFSFGKIYNNINIFIDTYSNFTKKKKGGACTLDSYSDFRLNTRYFKYGSSWKDASSVKFCTINETVWNV